MKKKKGKALKIQKGIATKLLGVASLLKASIHVQADSGLSNKNY